MSGSLHPSTRHLLDQFGYEHLPESLREVSQQFNMLAHWMVAELKDGPELSAGLRKLLEAKDCLVSIGDIEVIQRHHRYVVCWPSIHPEGRGYWWRNSAGQILGVPELADIPELPQRQRVIDLKAAGKPAPANTPEAELL